MALQLREHIPLAPLTSFKVGGPARCYAEPATVAEFAEALAFADQQGLPFFLLGKGTNLVFSDQGYAGLVIATSKRFQNIAWQDSLVTAQAGALLHTVVGQAVQRGYAGIERLAGIPGTMGGGTYINAGAFDQELKDVITRVRSSTRQGEVRERHASECGFSYRHSRFFDFDEIILETEMQLTPASATDLEKTQREILLRRKDKQPLQLPNAGSMFKRPPGTYAGLLIEQAGLKGLVCGGAQISDKHANFTVNAGGATAQDIWDLTSDVIARVREQSGITLEREVIFVGDFLPWPR
jgi:UDP-N-acetylmuramate dehydrogenase